MHSLFACHLPGAVTGPLFQTSLLVFGVFRVVPKGEAPACPASGSPAHREQLGLEHCHGQREPLESKFKKVATTYTKTSLRLSLKNKLNGGFLSLFFSLDSKNDGSSMIRWLFAQPWKRSRVDFEFPTLVLSIAGFR